MSYSLFKTIEAHKSGLSGGITQIQAIQGNKFVTCGSDKYVRVWDATTGAKVSEFQDDVKEKPETMSATGDGRRVVLTHLVYKSKGKKYWYEGHARLFVDGQLRWEITGEKGSEPKDAVIAESGSRIGVYLQNGTSLLYHGETFKQQAKLPGHFHLFHDSGYAFGSKPSRANYFTTHLPSGKVNKLDYGKWGPQAIQASLDFSKVVSNNYKKRKNRIFLVFDAKTGRRLREIDQAHEKKVVAMGLNRDGSRLVSSSKDGTIKVWDVNAGTCLQALEPEKYPKFLAVDPAGAYFICGRKGEVNLYTLGGTAPPKSTSTPKTASASVNTSKSAATGASAGPSGSGTGDSLDLGPPPAALAKPGASQPAPKSSPAPQATSSAPSGGGLKDQIVQRFSDLKELHGLGIINDVEYQAKKRELLDEL